MAKCVVLPGLTSTALGIARCLEVEDVWILAFGQKAPGYKTPLIYSNVPDKTIIAPAGEDVVTTLLKIREQFDDDPVLLLSEDRHVIEVSTNRAVLGSYRMLLPRHETVLSLMDKNRFAVLAKQRGWRAPRSITIGRSDGIERLLHEMPFPFALKAYMLPSRKISNRSQLEAVLSTFTETNWSSVLAQQWIPGDDSNLHFCFAYFDRDSEPLAIMTAQKVRQWRPNDGTTSLCRTTENHAIKEETIKIFRSLNYVGFGSIEYKYNPKDSQYYIMEPTVGRFNKQVALCRTAGVNLPVVALRNLLNQALPPCRQRNNIWWIHETHDLFSRLHPRQQVKESYLRRLATADTRALFARNDPWPLFASCGSLAKRSICLASSRLSRVYRPRSAA